MCMNLIHSSRIFLCKSFGVHQRHCSYIVNVDDSKTGLKTAINMFGNCGLASKHIYIKLNLCILNDTRLYMCPSIYGVSGFNHIWSLLLRTWCQLGHDTYHCKGAFRRYNIQEFSVAGHWGIRVLSENIIWK